MLETASGIKVKGAYDSLTYTFRANIAAKDKMALIEENQKPTQNTIKTAPSDDYSASYLGDYMKVIFEDERSKQLVSVNLSYSNVLGLIKNFKNDADNFFLRDDGALRLNGKVQNFVSGWFDKAAYDMNLLAADSDKNGLVEGKELSETFVYRSPFFLGNSNNPNDITELELYGGQKIAYDESGAYVCLTQSSIELVLNGFLRLDKNADNKISFAEYFGGEKALLSKAENGISSGEVENVNAKDFILEELKKLLKELQERFQKDDKNVKQKATQQGLQALSAAELELFKNQNPAEYERLKNEQAYTEFNEFEGFNDFKGENGLSDGALSENLDEINGGNLGLNLSENSSELSENLALNLNEKSGKILSENSSMNLNEANEISRENSSLNLDKINSKNSNDEALSPIKQKALNLLEKALSQDLLTQIKNQNLKIIDLRV